MKTISVCTHCGSRRVFQDAYAAINSDDVRTFDDIFCDDCEGACLVANVSVPDTFDIDTDTFNWETLR